MSAVGDRGACSGRTRVLDRCHVVSCAPRRPRGRRRALTLGDLSAVRDWSFAGDVLHGVHLALRHETAQDYIFASGVGHTVEEFVEVAFAHLGLDPARHVEIDPSFVRAPESVAPVGDPARAREALGWVPTHDLAQIVARMVDADVAELSA